MVCVIRIFIFKTGWKPNHNNCMSEGFAYQTSEHSVSSVLYGVFSAYNGGGYTAELDLDLGIALASVRQLEKGGWVDRFTRLVILESMIFNVNSRLFSRMRTYFEISPTGMVLSHADMESTRLYPYVEMVDYVTLVSQIIFIIITIERMMSFLYSLSKCRCLAAATLDMVIEFTQLVLALGYIVCYIQRIVATIDTIEDLMNNKGTY